MSKIYPNEWPSKLADCPTGPHPCSYVKKSSVNEIVGQHPASETDTIAPQTAEQYQADIEVIRLILDPAFSQEDKSVFDLAEAATSTITSLSQEVERLTRELDEARLLLDPYSDHEDESVAELAERAHNMLSDAEEILCPGNDGGKSAPDLAREAIARAEAAQAEVALLTAENAVLAAGACLCVKGDERGNAYCEMKRRAEAAEAEVARLRTALIEAGRAVGAFLHDGVSNDFLMGVPREAALVTARLTAERDAALERVKVLEQAVDQAVDDMGDDGLCVCQACKEMMQAAISHKEG